MMDIWAMQGEMRRASLLAAEHFRRSRAQIGTFARDAENNHTKRGLHGTAAHYCALYSCGIFPICLFVCLP